MLANKDGTISVSAKANRVPVLATPGGTERQVANTDTELSISSSISHDIMN